jgi:hypothetical protein
MLVNQINARKTISLTFVDKPPLRKFSRPKACETSRIPQFIDTRLVDGGEDVSPTRRAPFTPRKILGTHFC